MDDDAVLLFEHVRKQRPVMAIRTFIAKVLRKEGNPRIMMRVTSGQPAFATLERLRTWRASFVNPKRKLVQVFQTYSLLS